MALLNRDAGSSTTETDLRAIVQEAIEDSSTDETDRSIVPLLAILGVAVAVGYVLGTRVEPGEDGVQQRIGEYASETADRVGGMTAGPTGEDFSDRIEEGTEEAADSLGETGEEIAEHVEEGTESVGETAGDVAEEVEEDDRFEETPGVTE